MRWRDAIAYGWLLIILLALSGFAWLTHHPEAEILAAATDWPGK